MKMHELSPKTRQKVLDAVTETKQTTIEIARKCKLSRTTVKKYLPLLTEEGLVVKTMLRISIGAFTSPGQKAKNVIAWRLARK